MINKPLISIITVVYNGEKYLEETILSVINQTYNNIEYIIIDGGSTDGTIDIIKKYEDKICYWVSEPDKGIYDAMNKGIDFAAGDFAIFMNSGDIFFKNDTIEKVVENIEDENKVYFGRAKINNDISSWLYPTKHYNHKNIESWLKKSLPNHQAMFFPKSFYKNTFYDLSFKVGSDSDYKFMAENDCGFVFLNMTICKFELGGISSDFDEWKRTTQIIKDSWKISLKHRGLVYAIERFLRIFMKYLINKLLTTETFVDFLKKAKG